MAQKTGQWLRTYTFGGKLCENACQATSREILEVAKRHVVDAGYHPILSVYDEIVCEELLGFGSAEGLEKAMVDGREDWCYDWPLRVEAFESKRYRK